MPKIRCVALDIHGVLLPPGTFGGKKFEDMCALVLARRYRTSVEAGRKLYFRERGQYSTTSWLMKDHGCYKDYLDNFWRLPHADYQLGHRAMSLLERLKATGVRIAILTNNSRYYALQALERLGFAHDFFDLIICADEAEPRPHPMQFEMLVRGEPKGEFVFLGDRPDSDVGAAERFGIRGMLVQDNLEEVLESLVREVEAGREPRPPRE